MSHCKTCNGPLVFDSDMARGWHFFESECIHFLQDRARRVVRVFWRVRDASGNGDECEYELLSQARDCVPDGGKVYRVTVRRVAKVRT